MSRDRELILYGKTVYAPLLSDACTAMEQDGAEAREKALDVLTGLLSMAGSTGFYGNLWHVFLTRVIVSAENSYSLSAERRGTVDGGVRTFALHDMEIFREWFSCDLVKLAEKTGVRELALIADYRADESAGMEYSHTVRDRICSLAIVFAGCKTAGEMLSCADTFYRECGTGMLGLHRAFRIKTGQSGIGIAPIPKIAEVKFDDLVGYERAKELLKRNTEAFLYGAPANNCLLYGDAGTGKSTSIKALLNEYYDRGLRIVEVYRHEFRYLNDLIGVLKRRNYRFILYMDDLSFEEFETEYKYLKAVIEGGLEEKPDNILIYATSNRRHLIKEGFNDKAKLSDDDVHRSDTVQEKLSLYDRFGVTVYFGAPTPSEYGEIVLALARREGIDLPEEELLLEANRWELKHAGYSGRTARQLIDDLRGRESLKQRETEQKYGG